MSEQQATPAAEPSFREQVEKAEQAPAEPVQAEPEQVTATEETPEPVAQEKVEKVVPLAALHEERNRRKEAQELLRQQQAGQLELQRRLDYLTQLATQPPKQQIDPQSDPLGASLQKTDQTQEQVQNIAKFLAAQHQEQQVRQQQELVVSQARAADAQFTQRQPDAPEAIAFLKSRKAAEYVAAGMTESQAIQAVRTDEWNLCVSALNQGENPAEKAYEIAKALGYTPAQEKLAMQKQGQQAASPKGGSGMGGGKLSLEALLKLSPDEFAANTKGDKWRKLMGG